MRVVGIYINVFYFIENSLQFNWDIVQLILDVKVIVYFKNTVEERAVTDTWH